MNYAFIKTYLEKRTEKPRPFGNGVYRYDSSDGDVIIHMEAEAESAVFSLRFANHVYAAPLIPAKAPFLVPCELIDGDKDQMRGRYTRNDLIILEHRGPNTTPVNTKGKKRLVQSFHLRQALPDIVHQTDILPTSLYCLKAQGAETFIVLEPFGDSLADFWHEITFVPDIKEITPSDFLPRPGFVNIAKTFPGKPGRKVDLTNNHTRMLGGLPTNKPRR